MPPWIEVDPIGLRAGLVIGPGTFTQQGEAPRIVVTRPIGHYPIFDPPTGTDPVRVDYGRLVLYYVGTLALTAPFFVWRRRPAATEDDLA